MSDSSQVQIHRAGLEELEPAYRIVSEYYDAVDVLVREDRASFEHKYFGDNCGVWLASIKDEIQGCIALHHLPGLKRSGEIKRLYVRPEYRGYGIAEALLRELEAYAARNGYETLYLDSKPDLITAIRFYQRHGYQLCDRYNDNPQATVFMRKELGSVNRP